jgi:hypothetical protein
MVNLAGRGAAAAGALSVIALLALVVGLRLERRNEALVSLPVGSSLVKETYAEDEAVGEKIIARMSRRVHSPVWHQLIGSKKMRSALAAAVGAERLQPGASLSAASASFNLGNLLSGMPHPKRELVQQQLRLAAVSHPHPYAESVSPRQEFELAQGSANRRRSAARRERVGRPRAAPRARWWEPEMPDRLAANGWPQALSSQGRAHSQALHTYSPAPHDVPHTKFVFDEFAPGVLPGTSAAPAAAPKPATAPKPVAAPKPALATPKHAASSTAPASVKEDLEKATGFGDTIVKVGETPEDKLEKEVQHLRAMNEQEKKQFEKREQMDIEHNLVALERKQETQKF